MGEGGSGKELTQLYTEEEQRWVEDERERETDRPNGSLRSLSHCCSRYNPARGGGGGVSCNEM